MPKDLELFRDQYVDPTSEVPLYLAGTDDYVDADTASTPPPVITRREKDSIVHNRACYHPPLQPPIRPAKMTSEPSGDNTSRKYSVVT